MGVVLWLCGDFVVAGEALAGSGLGDYAMDLLAPVNGIGWSALFAGWPTATPGQAYEGLAYPGAGALALVATALVLVARRRPTHDDAWRLAPLAVSCAALVAVAVGPVAFAAGRPVWRLDAIAGSPMVAAFRANGRFVWPAEYAVVLGAALAVCARLRPRAAVAVLTAAIALQVVDLHAVWQRNYRDTRADAAFFQWESPLHAPAWRHAGAVFARVALVPAPECGVAAAPLDAFVRLAGDQGLALNSGTRRARRRGAPAGALAETARQVDARTLDPRTLYVVHPDRLGALRETPTITCVELDGLHGPAARRGRCDAGWTDRRRTHGDDSGVALGQRRGEQRDQQLVVAHQADAAADAGHRAGDDVGLRAVVRTKSRFTVVRPVRSRPWLRASATALRNTSGSTTADPQFRYTPPCSRATDAAK